MGEAGDDGGAVELLELVERAAIHEAGDDLARVVLRRQRRRHDAVELGRVVGRRPGRGERDVRLLRRVQPGDDAAHDGERVAVVVRIVIGDAGLAGVDVGAAEVLRRDDLPGGGLHQRRAGQEDGALPLDDDGLVAHRRHIGAARGTGAHDAGDLRNAGRRHVRLVEEDAAEMVAVGEDVGLVRQVRAAAIDEIDAGQPVLLRDLLRPQVLLHRDRIIGAALDRRVVADDDAFAARHAADAGDDPGAVDVALVHAIGGERRELEERRAGIDQALDPFARQELAAFGVALARTLVAAERRGRLAGAQLVDQHRHCGGVGLEGGGIGGHLGFELRHSRACADSALR